MFATTRFVRDFWSLPLLCATPVGRMVEQMTQHIDDKPVRPTGLLDSRQVNQRLLKAKTCLQTVMEENHQGNEFARMVMRECKQYAGVTQESLDAYLANKE